MSSRILRAGVLAALVVAAACGDSTGARPVPATLRFAEAEPVVEIGVPRRLEVAVLDDQGRPIAGAPVRFASSRPELVEVDSLTGMMTGKAPGSAEITAVAAPARATVAVSVQPPGGLVAAAVALAPRDQPLRRISEWPGAATLTFTVRNAAGASLCGLVPVQVEVADTAVARAAYAPQANGACAVAVQARALGSTWLRVRAGAAADSLRLQITPTTYEWSFAPPARKEVATTVRWHVDVRTGEGVPVSGVPVAFHYVEFDSLVNERNASKVDTVEAVTDDRGRASLERLLPSSTRSVATSYTSTTVRAWVTAHGRLPGGAAFTARDVKPVVPGPAVRLELRVWDCLFSYYAFCGSRASEDPVTLLTSLCRGQELVAVAFDAGGNPTSTAPTLTAPSGALAAPRLEQYVDSYPSPSFPDQTTRIWYDPSQMRVAALAAGHDSARVTVEYPGLPPLTADVRSERLSWCVP